MTTPQGCHMLRQHMTFIHQKNLKHLTPKTLPPQGYTSNAKLLLVR